MYKLEEVINFLDLYAPERIADEWDNVGLQIGNKKNNVKNILLALDLDKRVLDYAIKNDIDLIITHHPVFFKGIKSIDRGNYLGEIIYKLVENNISVYSAHTNLDKTRDGVNDVLFEKLGLREKKVLVEEDFGGLVDLDIYTDKDILKDRAYSYIRYEDHITISLDQNNKEDIKLLEYLGSNFKTKQYQWNDYYGYGRYGNLEPVNCKEYLKKIKKELKVDSLKVYGGTDKKISRVALLGGSGASFIEEAYKKAADLYITGDIKYHDAQLAEELGLILVDAGHYHTEKLILDKLKEKLFNVFKEMSIDIYRESSPLYSIY